MNSKTITGRFIEFIRQPLNWLRGQEVAVLVPLLIVVLGVWCFIELADEVTEGDAQTFDEWVVLHMRRADNPADPIGPEWLKKVALDITALGGATVLTLCVLCVAGYLLLERKRGAMWLVLVAAGGGWALTTVLKELIGRDRPTIVPHLVTETSMSFPSGHAMMSAVVYLTLGALLTRLVERGLARVYLLGVAVLLTFLVGISRILLGVHYPTDVLAGWVAGLVWALLCWTVERGLQRRGKVEGVGEYESMRDGE